VISELLGLGHARQLCFDRTTTKYLAFVDSDVEILRKDFLLRAIDILEDKQIGAVVGMAVGHRFAYGLPASLLLLRKSDFVGCVIPDYIDARETFFIQRRLEKLGLRTSYIFEAMIHRSSYRKYKPEWEGANTRLLPSPATKELAFTMKVILLLTLNSKSLTNFLYLPIFYMKFLRGFADPGRWSRLRRGDLQ
jgi:glycosyltransferase involved in cell wall biosynthesis